MVPMVRAPPRTGVPFPTPGLAPLAVVVLVDPLGLEEQPASKLDDPAPRATAPPTAAPRDKKVRRLNPLPSVTDVPHHFCRSPLSRSLSKTIQNCCSTPG